MHIAVSIYDTYDLLTKQQMIPVGKHGNEDASSSCGIRQVMKTSVMSHVTLTENKLHTLKFAEVELLQLCCMRQRLTTECWTGLMRKNLTCWTVWKCNLGLHDVYNCPEANFQGYCEKGSCPVSLGLQCVFGEFFFFNTYSIIRKHWLLAIHWHSHVALGRVCRPIRGCAPDLLAPRDCVSTVWQLWSQKRCVKQELEAAFCGSGVCLFVCLDV